jgi:hypothetical protein
MDMYPMSVFSSIHHGTKDDKDAYWDKDTGSSHGNTIRTMSKTHQEWWLHANNNSNISA